MKLGYLKIVLVMLVVSVSSLEAKVFDVEKDLDSYYTINAIDHKRHIIKLNGLEVDYSYTTQVIDAKGKKVSIKNLSLYMMVRVEIKAGARYLNRPTARTIIILDNATD